ncbi:2-oxo acid dehydrogenase subunit E2 [Epidermidibacterium keratini]|uniref:Dihydrolipoamide acetyltransferase component of pyruvate dehydrogenase complex n=1 Tax=Epidermidibacterium keratini TaxID=1891644 RepID=A0A7L4YL56_9ACTN|nr:dihydrolipoamide acetyltransferase family protein [Epidermidibacterium keratini]QHB99573.1 2-oxo acid dehydrogenase subunit E2 [Epidermidibacterium keratini]
MGVFMLPDLGEGLAEAQVLQWFVKVGDEVTLDQMVVEVETAKAAVEVPVPFAGIVRELHCAEGETLAVGAPLITIETVGAEGFREPGVVTAGAHASGNGAASSGSGNVLIGYGTPEEGPRRRRRHRASVLSSSETVAPAEAPVPDPAAASVTALRPGVISPVVRRLARDAGVDLAELAPADGDVIRRADVERAIAQRHSAEPSAAATNAGDPGVQRIKLTGARKFAADKFSQSRREIPEATVWVDVDATGLMEARRAIHSPERPVSVLAMLSRFAVAGLRRYPQLNSRVEGDEIVQHSAIGLGFAAQTDRGLVVPVVAGAERMSLRELSAAMGERTERARAGELTPAEMSGGTFTVNNYGVFGVDGSAAIINHPEAAILGMGRIIERPWVVDGEIVVRRISQLTIAFDHRVCDGGVAGGFLRFVADCIENPMSALAEL